MSFSLARKRKEVEKKEQMEGSTGGSSSPGLARLKKDINELYLPSTMKVSFDNDDISKFTVDFTPNEGYWKGGLFQFRFEVPLKDYPHKPPSIICLTQVSAAHLPAVVNLVLATLILSLYHVGNLRFITQTSTRRAKFV